MRSHWYHLQVTSNVENLKKNQRFSSEGVYNDEWKAFPPLPPAPRSHLIIPNIPAQRAVVFKKQLVNLVELCWYMDLLTLRKLCSLFIQQLYNMRSSTHLFLSHFLSFSSSSLSIYPSLFLLSSPLCFPHFSSPIIFTNRNAHVGNCYRMKKCFLMKMSEKAMNVFVFFLVRPHAYCG